MDLQARSNSTTSEDQATSNVTDAVLAEYLRRVEAGESVDREEFLKQCPAAAEALQSYFEGADLVERFAASQSYLRRATAGYPEESPAQSLRSAETIAPRGATDSTQVPAGPLTTLPTQFGRFRVERLLGGGAMGAVYWAWDTQLDRAVALKVPRLSGADDSDVVNRLLREAKAAASLSHPNICRVYDTGVEAGTYFIAMEFIDGQPLSDHITPDTFQDERRCVFMVRKIASALIDAHAKGITHRDLKPGNILINERGEPILTDFGLARRADSYQDVRLTQTGMMIGSPAYMSPEQVDSEIDRVGPCSDIYSLGVVLFELLTGQLPFRGSVVAILSQVVLKEPPLPSSLRPCLDPRLDAICRRMMAKLPEDRFVSMTEVEKELAAWLNAVPKPTRSASEATPSPVNSEASLARRVGVPAPLTENSAAALDDVARQNQHARKLLAEQDYDAAIPLLTKLAELDATRFKDTVAWAKTELPVAEQKQQRLRERITAACEKARAMLKKFAYFEAAQLLEAIPPAAHTRELRQLLAEATERADDCSALRQEIDDAVKRKKYDGLMPLVKRYLKLKPDNSKMQRLARDLIKNRPARAVAQFKGTRRYFDVAGRLIEPKEIALSLTLLVGLFAGVYFGVIYVLTPNGTLVVDVEGEGLAVVVQEGHVVIRDGKQEFRIEATDEKTLAVQHRGTTIDGTSRKITLKRGEKRTVTVRLIDADVLLTDNTKKFTFPRPQQPKLPAPGADGRDATSPGIAIVNQELARDAFGVLGHEVRYSPDGKWIACVTHIGEVRVYEAGTLKPVGAWSGHKDRILGLSWRPGTNEFSTSGYDGKISTWNVEGQELWNVPELPQTGSLAWSPDGGQLASSHSDGSIRLWSATNRTLSHYDKGDTGVSTVAWKPDGTWLAWGGDNRRVSVGRQNGQGKSEFERSVRNGVVESIDWSRKEDRLVSGSQDGSVCVWSLQGDKLLERQHPQGSWAVAWSPDGTRFASGGRDGQIRLWKSDGTPELVLEGHTALVTSLNWSPEGDRIASVSEDCSIRLWDVRVDVKGTIPGRNKPGIRSQAIH